MKIGITTHHPEIFAEFENAASDAEGILPAGLVFGKTMTSRTGRLAFGSPEVMTLDASLAAPVPVNMFSAWLYSRIRGRAKHPRIEDQEAALSVDDIERAITEIRSQLGNT